MNYKKLLNLIFALLAITSVRAQQGEILYREFDPPLEIVQNIYGPAQLLELDFDGDGEADHRFYGESSDNLEWHEWNLLEASFNGWETRLVYLDENDPYTYDENDTIIPNAPNGWRHDPDFVYYYYPNLSANGIFHETYGIHKVIDDKNFYGWYHGYGTEGSLYSGGPYEFRVYIDKIAFCTVPNYPLRYGQTSLCEGLEETTTTTFAAIHPNPTTDQVTLGLEQEGDFSVSVFDANGNLILTERNTAVVSFKDRPAGLYHIVVKQNGQRWSRKIIKM